MSAGERSEPAGWLPYAEVLDLVPGLTMIFDRERRLVFGNSAVLDSLGLSLPAAIGMLPGEVLGCAHASGDGDGCGDTQYCPLCGLAEALSEASRSGERCVRECSLLRGPGAADGAVDLRVVATPVLDHGQALTMLSVEDAGDGKRREALERIFFHDIMNSIVSMQSLAELIRIDIGDASAVGEYAERMVVASKNLIEEVRQQKDLLAMERGELAPEYSTFDAMSAIEGTVWLLERSLDARGMVEISPAGAAMPIRSDKALFGRIVRNAVKNAIEASGKGERVSIEAALAGGRLRVVVRNPAYMPRETQLRVFHRSYSTKGRGRGLGTYSMQLIARAYLKGEVSFSSDAEAGTAFVVDLPAEAAE